MKHASRTALGPTQPPNQLAPGALSLGVKRPGGEADQSPPSSAEAKEWVELYFNSLSTSSWGRAQFKEKAQGQLYLLPLPFEAFIGFLKKPANYTTCKLYEGLLLLLETFSICCIFNEIQRKWFMNFCCSTSTVISFAPAVSLTCLEWTRQKSLFC
jgi:hypothetical protein